MPDNTQETKQTSAKGWPIFAVIVVITAIVFWSAVKTKDKKTQTPTTPPAQPTVTNTLPKTDLQDHTPPEPTMLKADESLPEPTPAEETTPTKTNKQDTNAQPILPIRTPTLTDIAKIRRSWDPILTNHFGQNSPDFTVTDINGKQHKISGYKGKNVLIIFWATWCGPCKVEIPHLIELRKETPEDQLVILAISNENPRTVKSFAEQAKLNYTVVSNNNPLPPPYNEVKYIPAACFIDKKGNLKFATSGVISLPEIKAIIKATE